MKILLKKEALKINYEDKKSKLMCQGIEIAASICGVFRLWYSQCTDLEPNITNNATYIELIFSLFLPFLPNQGHYWKISLFNHVHHNTSAYKYTDNSPNLNNFNPIFLIKLLPHLSTYKSHKKYTF